MARTTKKKKTELTEEDTQLIKKCLAASPAAMADIERFEKLGAILVDIAAHAKLIEGTATGLLDFIFKCYFRTGLLNPRVGQELRWPDGKGGWTTASRDLKIERRNAMRGCAEIEKLTPLRLYNDKDKAAAEAVNIELRDIQGRIKDICERHFDIRKNWLEAPLPNSRELKAEIKGIMDKGRIVDLVTRLRKINYTERGSCMVVKKLIEFSKYPELVTWQAIRNRCRRA